MGAKTKVSRLYFCSMYLSHYLQAQLTRWAVGPAGAAHDAREVRS